MINLSTESIFKTWFHCASLQAWSFGQSYVKQTLPNRFLYDVRLNQSHDLGSNLKTYPDDNGKLLSGVSDDMAKMELVREGMIPVWIDIQVSMVGKDHTVLDLICSGRYTDDSKLLYYVDRGTGCFGVKSPCFPFGYKAGKKFKIASSPYAVKA